MRRAFIRLTHYTTTNKLWLNPTFIGMIQCYDGGSKITTVTGEEVFVQESPAEIGVLLNE